MAPRGSPAAMAPHGPLLRLGASLAVRRSVVDGSWTANRERDGAGREGEGRPRCHGRGARGEEGWSRAHAGRQRAGEGGRMASRRHGWEGEDDGRALHRSQAEASSRRLTCRGRCSASPLQLRARRREGEEWWRSEGAGRGRRRQLGGRSERRQGEEYAAEERAERRKLQSLPSDKHRMDRKIFSDVARLRAHGVPLESYIEISLIDLYLNYDY